MSYDYRSGRQTDHLKNMPDAEFNARFAAIAEAFDPDWLTAEGDHPLQLLWQRKDKFAVNQLCLLGDALAGLKPVDQHWVDDQIRNIKGTNVNTRRGSMFELLGVNLFRHSPQTIRPTKRSAPGYDAVLSLRDGSQVDISIKSYGTSSHESTFRKQAASTEQVFIESTKARQSNGAVLMVLADTYPSTSDWDVLRAALNTGASDTAAHKIGIWNVKVGALPAEYAPYSSHHFSYQVFFFAPFHANESKNLFDKFYDAFVNAREHAAIKADSVRVVLLRVPETISLMACDRWAKEYIAANPQDPIDGVYLYQLTVLDQPNDQSVLSHAFAITETPRFSAWRSPPGAPRRVLAINLSLGVCTQPTHRQMIGGPVPLRLDEGYLYQKGDFYTLHKVDWKKPTSAMMRNLASGIFQHAVLEDSKGHITLGGYFPPLKEISLFD